MAIVTGFEPSRLPPALLDIPVYKLTFAPAAGLLAAGAIVRRYAKRDADQVKLRESGLPHVKPNAPRLPDAPAQDFVPKPEQPSELRVPRER